MKKANMPNSNFRGAGRFALTAVATAMLGVSAQQATAQTTSSDPLEELVVTGIRSSLERSSEIKRNASGVVDAISAEDIGKFPDANLAESLQRVTGVSIDRENNEGNQITVRGFGPRFNLVTLNGRTLPTSNALFSRFLDRSFNFNELASSSVSGVEVFKTGRADLPTGGIGSTVNIRTAKPFDYDDFKFVANVKAVHDTTNETGSDFTPDVSFLVSDHWNDKKIGFLASLSYQERDSRLETGLVDLTQRAFDGAVESAIDFGANTNPRNALFLARNFILETADVQRERVNGQFVLQLAPTDNLEIDIDYHLSRFDELTLRNGTGFWFGFDGQRSGVSDANGVVSLRDAGNNIDVDAFGFAQDLVTDNDSFGINIDWNVSDNFRLNVDAHSSQSESQPGNETAELVINFHSPNVDLVGADFGDGDIPNVLVEAAGFDPFDPANLTPDIGQQRGRQILNEVDEFKILGEYLFDNETALQRVTFGASYQDYSYRNEETQTFFLIDGVTDGVPDFDASGVNIIAESRGSRFSDFSGGGPGLFPSLFRYDPRDAVAAAQAQGFFTEPTEAVERVLEETTSLFASADFQTAIGNMPLAINVGVRYEETDVVGQTAEQPILATEFINDAELRLVRGDGFVFDTVEGNYDFILPSVDFKLDVNENLVARFSYSETITRQPIAALTPSTSFNALRPATDGGTGSFIAVQGNAGLEPAEAENLDFSLEWYYKPGSYASLGLFNKDVLAFTATDIERQTLPDSAGNPIANPGFTRPGCPGAGCLSMAGDTPIIFDVQRDFNSPDEGTVRGAEFAWQHVFDNGFGFVLNYTYTDGDIEFDLGDFETQAPAPLTGLSDSANVVGFYEKGPWSARVAWNWRDDFLLVSGAEPIFTEAFSQVDFSASYNISDTYSVFVEGLNITDETTRRHGRSSRTLDRAFSSGPRFSVGFRGNF